MPPPQLLRIDELCIGDHSYLTDEDECYYFMEYTARESYNFSPGNSLIMNYKKGVDKKNTPQWKYKEAAIKQVAGFLSQSLPSIIDFNASTVIPIPPSKIKTNPLYDDRVLRTLQLCCKDQGNVRDVLSFREDMEAVHNSEHRPSPLELVQNLELNVNGCNDLRDTVVLFDDVLTTGSHFVACKRTLLNEFPDLRIMGVFIARRVIPNTAATDFADL